MEKRDSRTKGTFFFFNKNVLIGEKTPVKRRPPPESTENKSHVSLGFCKVKI